MQGGIPEHVQRFVAAHISSIETLEVLLLLRGTRERHWAPSEVAREIGSSIMSIQDRLGRLAAKGFLVGHEAGDELRYTYDPLNEEERTIGDLATAYKQRRLSVVSLIYARPPPSDIESFADAFRLRKDKKG